MSEDTVSYGNGPCPGREEVQLAPGVVVKLARNQMTGNVYATIGQDEASFVWCNVTASYMAIRQQDCLVMRLREEAIRLRDEHYKCSACTRTYRESVEGIACCARKLALKTLLDQFDDVPKGNR